MYCKHCASVIDDDCIICPKCGKQVNEIKTEAAIAPQIVINNENANTNVNNNNINGSGTNGLYNGLYNGLHYVKKWPSFLLCLFFGYFGAHKFYEGRTKKGILYLLTFGLLGIGWMVDIVVILLKPNPYPVKIK